MTPRLAGIVAGLSGILAAYIATQLVTWPTAAKAFLAAVVCGTVTYILGVALAKK
jgi:hypothetical protein